MRTSIFFCICLIFVLTLASCTKKRIYYLYEGKNLVEDDNLKSITNNPYNIPALTVNW